MPRVFIFSQQVKQVLNAGKKEIEIPEGARLSAAASDLIRENNLKIKTVAPHVKPDSSAQPPEIKPVKKKTEAPQPIDEASASRKNKSDSPAETGGEISDDILEEIANRVVERFKQVKGIESTQTTRKTAEQAVSPPAPADDDNMIICRCEEITKGEIKNAIRDGMQTLNSVKRITRAGMGLCQGQTCQQLVSRLLAEELGLNAAEVEPITARGPVRPLRLEVFANR
jgi:bacterioferritin-associated ferredoxin